MIVDPAIYCQGPKVDKKRGVKPAGLLSIAGIIYMAVELHNYGDNPDFNRQHNINSWIITSSDYGKSWNKEATELDFFTGRLASPHFLQFGEDYKGSRDEFVYAYFPAAEDGNSYWCNGDFLLLGRVNKEKLLERGAWQFYIGSNQNNESIWSKDDNEAQSVFR